MAKKKSVARSNGSGNSGRSSTPDNLNGQIDSTPEKVLKKKHVYKSKRAKQAAPVRQRNPSNASLAVSDFLDTTLWAK